MAGRQEESRLGTASANEGPTAMQSVVGGYLDNNVSR